VRNGTSFVEAAIDLLRHLRNFPVPYTLNHHKNCLDNINIVVSPFSLSEAFVVFPSLPKTSALYYYTHSISISSSAPLPTVNQPPSGLASLFTKFTVNLPGCFVVASIMFEYSLMARVSTFGEDCAWLMCFFFPQWMSP